jgi:hypothetical protein
MASNPKGKKKNFLLEFTNVTNEERNNIVRFIRDPSNHDLANTSNNFHCVYFPCSTVETKMEITSKT